MKRKNLLTTTALALVMMAFVTTGFCYVRQSRVAALTTPELSATVDVTTTPTDEQTAPKTTVPVTDEPAFVATEEIDPTEAEPTIESTEHQATESEIITEPKEQPTPIETQETVPEETEQDATEIIDTDNSEHEYSNNACDHFWRREYEPETESEEGYLIDSCLYCGEWYIYQVIEPYGE